MGFSTYQTDKKDEKERYKRHFILLKLLSSLFYILFLISFIATIYSVTYLNQLKISSQNHYDSYLLSEQLRHSSDNLTTMARAYAATGNEKYHVFFNEILAIRNGNVPRPKNYHRVYWDILMPEQGQAPFPRGSTISLDRLLERLSLTQAEIDILITARQKSDALTLLEDKSFTLVKRQENPQALAILYSEDYLLAKASIMADINDFYRLREKRTESLVKGSEDKLYYSASIAIIAVFIMVIIICYRFYIIAKLDRREVGFLNEKVQFKTKEIREKNEQLEIMLTDLKKTQDKLIESEKMSVLGGLVAGVAHELNTPIGVGITASSNQIDEIEENDQLMQGGKMTKNQFVDFMEHLKLSAELIFSNLNRVAHLIDSFKKVAVDQELDDKRTVHLKAYVDEVISTLSSLFRDRSVSIVNTIDENLEVEIFPGSIARIITAILLNSLEHAFTLEDSGTIHFSANLVGNEVEFKIEDDGKGMDERTQTHIYDPFFTTARDSGGIGLGMNVVYNIVTQKLGGDIQCNSALNKGTEIVMKWPS